MTKAYNNNTKEYSAKSAKSAKSVSSKNSKSSNQIIKKFMEKLPTTEEIIKKYKDNGRANIRLTISSVKDINKLDEKKIVNEDFNSIVKGLLKMNKKPLNFVTKPSKFSKK
jgi:hypothetical protein